MKPSRTHPLRARGVEDPRRGRGLARGLAFGLALGLALPALAQTAVPSFELDRDPSKLVLSFDEEVGAIARPDPIPLLRIYADGLAKVHVPAYMRGSGDYRLRLDPLRLRTLVRELLSAGVMDLDDRQVRRHRRRLGTRRDAAGLPRRRTDPATVRIELRLARLAGRPAVRHVLRWPGLRGDARDFPSDVRVRDVKRGVDALWRICHDPRLQRDPSPSR
ncbi:MAG: hypothetical protein ACE5IL_13100 [Myxococcota bacterium]